MRQHLGPLVSLVGQQIFDVRDPLGRWKHAGVDRNLLDEELARADNRADVDRHRMRSFRRADDPDAPRLAVLGLTFRPISRDAPEQG